MKLDKDIVKNKKQYSSFYTYDNAYGPGFGFVWKDIPAAQTNLVHKRVSSYKTISKLIEGYTNLGIKYMGYKQL
tara:strand:- start:684 stop:905 length:222 start_codon:yes stop_codon:yes gene_type:complete